MESDSQSPVRLVDRRLMVEGVTATALAERFGTPLYVMSDAQLRRNVREWLAALEGAWTHGPTRVLVSLKANPSIALRRILNEEGAGCDVFGAAELEIALRAEVRPELISVNGSTKPAALIDRAIAVGARLTLDSVEELEAAGRAARTAGATARVRLRLRPDMTDVETTSEFTEDVPLGAAADAYKPGIPMTELLAALPKLDLAGVSLIGVHAHLGRHTADPEPFRLHARRMGALVGELNAALGGWLPEEIDLGGGYSFAGDPTGLALRPQLAAASPAEYADAIASGLAGGLAGVGIDPGGIALEIEPGRAVYGSAGVHLSRVLNVKHQTAPVTRTWVGCDSSEVLLSDTTWEHSRWQPVPAEPIAGEPAEVDVVGVSCGFDTIAGSTPLPAAVAPGDLLAFLATGAYEETLAGNFNSMPRPASVLVSGTAADLIRRAETLDDVLARERLPGAVRPSQPRVLGVDHVAVAVADLDRSLEFYAGLLGLRVRDRGPVDPGPVERMTGLPGAEVEFADIELGGRTLELLHYRTPQPRGGAPLRPERPGVLHIALEVEDADLVHERLSEAGFAPLSPPERLEDDGSDWAGCLVFYVRDPDGALLEIVQRPARAQRVVRPAPTAGTASYSP